MKLQESFEIEESPQRVWEFLNQPEQVAACVPGVESVEELDEDNLRVQLTQTLGPMTATFALKMSVTERVDREALAFTAIGRVVRGASGSVRSTNRVRLEDLDGDGTRVNVDADLAMGGMLGSVGQKVVSKQAASVTGEFASALQRALRGESVSPGEPPSAAAAARGEPDTGPAPVPSGGGIMVDVSDWRVLSVLAAALLLIAWLAGRNAGANAAYARLARKGQLQ